MKNVREIDKKLLLPYGIIIAVSFFLSACYMYEWYAHCENTLLFPEHASQAGYNFYRYGSITRLYEKATYDNYGVIGAGIFIDEAPDMRDTVGYAFLLGLLWKIAGSAKFYWVSLVQIVLFALSLCLLYQSVFWYYQDSRKALCAIFGVIAFLPGVFISVQPVKDIWSFYATTVVVWALIGLILQKINNKSLFAVAIFFALCQWMRSPVFGVLLALLVVGVPIFYFYFKSYIGVLKKLLIYFSLANLSVFWIPWISYNKVTYDRFFVGPTGLALLSSLGTRPNPWGVEMSEIWFENHVRQTYPEFSYRNGTQEFDDLGRKSFVQYFKEDPSVYFKNLFSRFPGMIFLEMPWCVQPDYFLGYKVYNSSVTKAFYKSFQEGVTGVATFGVFFIYKVLLYLYIKLFLLLAYLGIFVSFIYRKDYLLPFLILIAVGGNCGEVVSHIELKYLMQCYGFLGIFVGTFMFDVAEVLHQYSLRKRKKDTSFNIKMER